MTQKEKDAILKYLSNAPKEASPSYIIIDSWGGQVDYPSEPAAFDNHRGVLYGI